MKKRKRIVYDEDAATETGSRSWWEDEHKSGRATSESFESVRIKGERERLKKLKAEAMRGFSADVLDAISLLKDRGLLDREYDPRMHYLRWRRFPEFRIELYNFEEEFE